MNESKETAMMHETTITVKQEATLPVIRMHWHRMINIGDVQVAFRLVRDMLDRADGVTHVVIDMMDNPRFPLLTTLNCLISGPFHHAQMGEWLILGSSSQARLFAKTLGDMKANATIRYFATEAQVTAHMEHLAQPLPDILR